MNKIENFRLFVNKVLPTVYDDSLSYYELLNKIVNHVNGATDQVNNLSSAFSKVLTDVLPDNLKNIVEQLKTDGDLDEIINEAIFHDLSDNLNTTSVNLTNHSNNTDIHKPLFFVHRLPDSLTQYPAGSLIAATENMFNLTQADFQNKSISSTTGEVFETTDATRLSTIEKQKIKPSIKITVELLGNYEFVFLQYDKAGNFLGNTGSWHGSAFTFTVDQTTSDYHMVIRRPGNAEIELSEIINMKPLIYQNF